MLWENKLGKNNKKTNKNNQNQIQKNHLELKEIQPLTDTQNLMFESYDNGKNILAHGFAGTGKTFISLYLALEEILTGNSKYDKIIIVRSVVPSRDMGFLPGSASEKSKIYEEPYKEICSILMERSDSYELLKTKGNIIFTTTSFLRGLTFNNAIVIVDEIQNMLFSEIDTVMTRLGDNTRVIFCGDFRQTDFKKNDEKSGIFKFMQILNEMRNFEYIEFKQNDIVRSGIVKDYIIAKTKLEDSI